MSVATDYCDFSDLPTDQCAHCKPKPSVAGLGQKGLGFRRGVGIRAEFEGMCPGCDENIDIGDLIVRDDEGDWNHKECV